MKSFAASGDLSTAVVCLFDSTVTVWDLNTGSVTVPLQRWGERDETKGHTSGEQRHLHLVMQSHCVMLKLAVQQNGCCSFPGAPLSPI